METQNLLSDLYDLAYRAHSGTSFSPEKRAKSLIKEHSQELEEDLQKIPDEFREDYIKKYRSKMIDWLSAKSRCISTMITGPANFPVRRAEKANRSEHNKSVAFSEFRINYFNRLQKQAERNKTPEEKETDFLNQVRKNLEDSFQTLYEIDNGINKYSLRSLIASNLNNRIKTIIRNNSRDKVLKVLDLVKELNQKYSTKKPIITDRNGIWKLFESVQEKEPEEDTPENETFLFEGGKVILNYTENRLQITHNSIPDYQTRQLLKQSGFKWSPLNTAWQRQLTESAKYEASTITGVNYQN